MCTLQLETTLKNFGFPRENFLILHEISILLTKKKMQTKMPQIDENTNFFGFPGIFGAKTKIFSNKFRDTLPGVPDQDVAQGGVQPTDKIYPAPDPLHHPHQPVGGKGMCLLRPFYVRFFASNFLFLLEK